MDWVLELRDRPFGDHLEVFFHLLTLSGDITFFLIFLPLGFWFWRRSVFARATLLLLIASLAPACFVALGLARWNPECGRP